MSLEAFIDSKPFTFGVELEMQIVNTHDYDLTKAGTDLLRLIKDGRPSPICARFATRSSPRRTG